LEPDPAFQERFGLVAVTATSPLVEAGRNGHLSVAAARSQQQALLGDAVELLRQLAKAG
jgi:hypothetical protein